MPRFYYSALLIRRKYLYKDHFCYSTDTHTEQKMKDNLEKQIADLNAMVPPEDKITIVPGSEKLDTVAPSDLNEIYKKPFFPKMELPNGKYIKFVDTSITGNKTKMFLVVNTENEESIGLIKWYGPFRKYSFFPNANTVFEHKCLRDITSVLEGLMEMRKLEKDVNFVPNYVGTAEELNKSIQK